MLNPIDQTDLKYDVNPVYRDTLVIFNVFKYMLVLMINLLCIKLLHFFILNIA